jgi:hypothetical protein
VKVLAQPELDEMALTGDGLLLLAANNAEDHPTTQRFYTSIPWIAKQPAGLQRQLKYGSVPANQRSLRAGNTALKRPGNEFTSGNILVSD